MWGVITFRILERPANTAPGVDGHWEPAAAGSSTISFAPVRIRSPHSKEANPAEKINRRCLYTRMMVPSRPIVF